MKVLVTPRAPENPYQRRLYGALAQLGVESRYLPTPTFSQTLNLLLIPALLVLFRVRGFRILHVHWVYPFAPAWVRHIPLGRSAMQAWFQVCLACATALGYRLVWTAHNLLPHEQVFADDEVARRALVRRCSAVIDHSAAADATLRSLGAGCVRFVPVGSYEGSYPRTMSRRDARTFLGLPVDGRVVAFVGTIDAYKGVDTLLEAARRLPRESVLSVIIAGRCQSRSLQERLDRLAEGVGCRIITRYGYIPDSELEVYFEAADAIVLPFRSVTNSGSVVLAFSFGRPVVIPALEALRSVPERAAIRYPPGLEGLTIALAQVAGMEFAEIEVMAKEAKVYAASLTWERSARETLEVYEAALVAGER